MPCRVRACDIFVAVAKYCIRLFFTKGAERHQKGSVMADKNDTTEDTIVIKKYANRRLYNTEKSSYVTLDHLAEMVREGQDFVVTDAKSGEDITRSVLTQIIFEEESKGHNMLPTKFLRQLISLYGDSVQGFVPGYLDASMEAFAKNQDFFRGIHRSKIPKRPITAQYKPK